MNQTSRIASGLDTNGFEIVEQVYSHNEIREILSVLDSGNIGGSFGVRELLEICPELKDRIFTPNFTELLLKIAPGNIRLVKAVYFDKPPTANWIVNWHQDVTINLIGKKDVPGFRNWRVHPNRVVVQPPVEILESMFTTRIHLDDCSVANGALRVMTGSHRNGVVVMKSWERAAADEEHICEAAAGDIMLMKPLTMHSSRRAENQKNRRVIHLEFCTKELPNGLEWKEGFRL